jgi:Zn-dependent protease with chaperone function
MPAVARLMSRVFVEAQGFREVRRMASELVSTRTIRLRDYRYPGEVLSLLLTFVALLSLFALATLFFPSTWSQTMKTLAVTVAGLSVYIFSVKLQQRAAFGTLVRVSPRQFPELFELASVAAENLSSAAIPVYVKRQSEMNIYTLGLWQRPLIVLTSSLVDQMPHDALQFFIGREIGHIQAGHTWLRTLLKPLGADVPIIGKLLNSVIFGDWMNRTEFTADRAGFIACRSLTTAVTTMLKFGVGIRLYEKLDIREFLEQINEVRNVSGHLTEIMAEMPYLTQRIRTLVRFALSERAHNLVPDKHSNTGILKDLPTAFINTTRLKEVQSKAAEPALPPAPASYETQEAPLPERPTITDYEPLETQDDADENALDTRLLLIPQGSTTPHLLRRRLTRIGRNLDNDIVIQSDRISRYHVEIERQGRDFVITDKNSRNGVWVNGAKITAPTLIQSGDTLRIGRQEFTFQIKHQAHEHSETASSLTQTI